MAAWDETKTEAGLLCNFYQRIGNPLIGGAI